MGGRPWRGPAIREDQTLATLVTSRCWWTTTPMNPSQHSCSPKPLEGRQCGEVCSKQCLAWMDQRSHHALDSLMSRDRSLMERQPENPPSLSAQKPYLICSRKSQTWAGQGLVQLSEVLGDLFSQPGTNLATPTRQIKILRMRELFLGYRLVWPRIWG